VVTSNGACFEGRWAHIQPVEDQLAENQLDALEEARIRRLACRAADGAQGDEGGVWGVRDDGRKDVREGFDIESDHGAHEVCD
jgi:hypothetical protein